MIDVSGVLGCDDRLITIDVTLEILPFHQCAIFPVYGIQQLSRPTCNRSYIVFSNIVISEKVSQQWYNTGSKSPPLSGTKTESTNLAKDSSDSLLTLQSIYNRTDVRGKPNKTSVCALLHGFHVFSVVAKLFPVNPLSRFGVGCFTYIKARVVLARVVRL
jgi:hypothetical protein